MSRIGLVLVALGLVVLLAPAASAAETKGFVLSWTEPYRAQILLETRFTDADAHRVRAPLDLDRDGEVSWPEQQAASNACFETMRPADAVAPFMLAIDGYVMRPAGESCDYEDFIGPTSGAGAPTDVRIRRVYVAATPLDVARSVVFAPGETAGVSIGAPAGHTAEAVHFANGRPVGAERVSGNVGAGHSAVVRFPQAGRAWEFPADHKTWTTTARIGADGALSIERTMTVRGFHVLEWRSAIDANRGGSVSSNEVDAATARLRGEGPIAPFLDTERMTGSIESYTLTGSEGPVTYAGEVTHRIVERYTTPLPSASATIAFDGEPSGTFTLNAPTGRAFTYRTGLTGATTTGTQTTGQMIDDSIVFEIAAVPTSSTGSTSGSSDGSTAGSDGGGSMGGAGPSFGPGVATRSTDLLIRGDIVEQWFRFTWTDRLAHDHRVHADTDHDGWVDDVEAAEYLATFDPAMPGPGPIRWNGAEATSVAFDRYIEANLQGAIAHDRPLTISGRWYVTVPDLPTGRIQGGPGDWGELLRVGLFAEGSFGAGHTGLDRIGFEPETRRMTGIPDAAGWTVVIDDPTAPGSSDAPDVYEPYWRVVLDSGTSASYEEGLRAEGPSAAIVRRSFDMDADGEVSMSELDAIVAVSRNLRPEDFDLRVDGGPLSSIRVVQEHAEGFLGPVDLQDPISFRMVRDLTFPSAPPYELTIVGSGLSFEIEVPVGFALVDALGWREIGIASDGSRLAGVTSGDVPATVRIVPLGAGEPLGGSDAGARSAADGRGSNPSGGSGTERGDRRSFAAGEGSLRDDHGSSASGSSSGGFEDPSGASDAKEAALAKERSAEKRESPGVGVLVVLTGAGVALTARRRREDA